MVIALDEALSVAQALNELTIDTDHLLGVMTEREVGTAGLLTQFGSRKRRASTAHPPPRQRVRVLFAPH